jgi:hypothetical protein
MGVNILKEQIHSKFFPLINHYSSLIVFEQMSCFVQPWPYFYISSRFYDTSVV